MSTPASELPDDVKPAGDAKPDDTPPAEAKPGNGEDQFAWPDGWRGQLAAGMGDDAEKEAKRLERFESPDQIYKSWRETDRRISAGELRSKLADNAPPAEVSKWRKENGVPEKADGYVINMPQGREKPADDDAFLQSFLSSAHEGNYTQGQVDNAVASFYGEVDRQIEATAEAEKVLEQQTEDALRQDWGSDYRTNKAMAEALLTRAPEGFRDRFMNGYLSDHTPIRASSEAWRWLVQMEREINPAATVVPGAGGDVGKTVQAKILEYKKMMKDLNGPYHKGVEAEGHQKHYRDLLDADRRMREKSGQA